MSGSADLFPGFAWREVDVGDATLHMRIAGDGPPLVLLHGYPQSHVMWRRVAPDLARRFTLVIPDLRGYGRSSIPASQNGERYSKRVMGSDIVALMEKLGHRALPIAGHDRGGRVAYRLAFDHPEKVEKLATLDIVPTGEMWPSMDAARAMRVYHWLFLAQAAPCRDADRARRANISSTRWRVGPAISRSTVSPTRSRLPRRLRRPAAHSCDVRGLSRRRDDRP